MPEENPFRTLIYIVVKIQKFIGISLIFGVLLLVMLDSNGQKTKDFLSDPVLKFSTTGISVVDLRTGEMLMSQNPRLLITPASTLKLLTTATAIEILGPDYRFKTEFGYSGSVQPDSGILEGNLIVRGGGDPTLGSHYFKDRAVPEPFLDSWVKDIKKAGITSVKGDLLMDVSCYERYTTPGSWAWEDIGNYYGSAPSALTYSDNMVRLYFDTPEQPGEPAILKGCVPEVENVTWLNEVKSSLINRDLAYVYGSPWSEKKVIIGSLPAGRKDFAVKASMPEPALCLGVALKEKLEEAGIRFSGIVRLSSEPLTFRAIAEVLSPGLTDIIRIVNHESVNLFAEHLLLEIARNTSGAGSLKKGIEAIQHFWREHGVRDTFFLEDGSGLSRFNAISASHLTHVLHYMHQSSSGGLFRLSLPSAGKGTLSSFSIHDFPGNSLLCKSGSMERVQGYAGYLVCDSGREVAFAVLCNNFPLTQAEMVRKMQKLILGIKQEF